jgi:glycosyltransferase involved in cell wall biosynthesis
MSFNPDQVPPSPLPPRILIFVVAYNARTTLTWVLDRIPASLRRANVEVLVIDDSSPDDTFQTGVDYASRQEDSGLKITILRNPENQGYGGNQKLGYRYALENGFDAVALVHGDGQYAPECLPELLAPLLAGEADAVFGSRMLARGDARRGGMPAYKRLGNRVLTRFQNALLGTGLSEFHSGYRLYSTRALRRIPFERNTNDFHFDTEIIIQLVLAGQRIKELPIPTHYGDEVCHVNGMKYAWDVCKTMLRARVHLMNLLHDRRFEVHESPPHPYDRKLDYPSSHTFALDAARPGGRVLNVGGSGKVDLAPELAAKGCRVTSLDRHPPVETAAAGREGRESVEFIAWNLDGGEFPVDVSRFDQIFLMDMVEHLKEPERFMEELRFAARRQRPEVVITTANIGFVVTRLMLLFGQFNYGRRGILDRTHRRLFTFGSLRTLLEQAGYRIIETRGVPAPFDLALRRRGLSRFLLRINEWLIRASKGLFSYQIFIRAQALPSVHHLLEQTLESSDALRSQYAAME